MGMEFNSFREYAQKVGQLKKVRNTPKKLLHWMGALVYSCHRNRILGACESHLFGYRQNKEDLLVICDVCFHKYSCCQRLLVSWKIHATRCDGADHCESGGQHDLSGGDLLQHVSATSRLIHWRYSISGSNREHSTVNHVLWHKSIHATTTDYCVFIIENHGHQ